MIVRFGCLATIASILLLGSAPGALANASSAPTAAPQLASGFLELDPPTAPPATASFTPAPSGETATATPNPTLAACAGNCNADAIVSVNELVTGVNIALGVSGVSACRTMDQNGNERVEVNELIAAVSNALLGCGPRPTSPPTRTRSETPTATSSPPPTSTATATLTATHTVSSTPTRSATPTRTATSTRRPTRTRTVTPTPFVCPHVFTDQLGPRAALCGYEGPFNLTCGLPDLFGRWVSDGELVVGIMEDITPTLYIGARPTAARRATLFGWSTDAFQTYTPMGGTMELQSNGQWIIAPNTSPFTIGRCPFERYIGTFTELSVRNASTASAATAADLDALGALRRHIAGARGPDAGSASP
ncbi:MAG: hypothetical protein AB7V27_10465 [Candidatus Binatia bacterium]